MEIVSDMNTTRVSLNWKLKLSPDGLGLIDHKGAFFLAGVIDSDYQVELKRERATKWSEEIIYTERAGLWYIG